MDNNRKRLCHQLNCKKNLRKYQFYRVQLQLLQKRQCFLTERLWLWFIYPKKKMWVFLWKSFIFGRICTLHLLRIILKHMRSIWFRNKLKRIKRHCSKKRNKMQLNPLKTIQAKSMKKFSWIFLNLISLLRKINRKSCR